MNAVTVERLEYARPEGFRLGPLGFELASGSHTALLGPSGSGKTTLLRCIAGLETPRAGRIRIGEKHVFDGRVAAAPHDRDVGLVFQSGALWPHMDAVEHLRFAAPKLTRADAVATLERFGLADRADRRPSHLSGGEMQRLALARALVRRPKLLLLDEPLKSIDVHARAELALLIRRHVEESGTTMLTVTHDRDEALLLASDGIVMQDGRVAEIGTLVTLEAAPATAHSAALLGRGACIPLARHGDNGSLDSPFGVIPSPNGARGPFALVLLPSDLELAASTATAGVVEGRVLHCVNNGATMQLHVELFGRRVLVSAQDAVPVGTSIRLTLKGAPRVLAWESQSSKPVAPGGDAR